MAKYKQGYADRKDESLGMKDGKESSKSQSYKSRRDESYAMERNERYGMGGKGVMGHDKKPMSCDPFAAQKSDMGRVKREPQTNRGYPSQAWDYKY